MRRNKKRLSSLAHALRAVVFVLLFVGLIRLIQPVLIPKLTVMNAETGIWRSEHFAKDSWMTYTREFEAEPKNSIDILFFGASHVYCGINPIQLWQERGVTSFVRSSSGQTAAQSLYLLKEALRTQTPRLVCLDVYGSTPYVSDMEDRWPMLFESAAWNGNTLTAMLENAQEQPLYSRLLPFLNYRDRVFTLTARDYMLAERTTGMKGFQPTYGEFQPWQEGDPWSMDTDEAQQEQIDPALDEIVALCKENNIPLFLYKLPAASWNAGYSEAMQSYAAQQGVPFLDLTPLVGQLGLQPSDFMNDDHLNARGAQKVTAYLGEVLTQQYTFPDHSADASLTAAWNEDVYAYARDSRSQTLRTCNDLAEYLTLLNDSEYTVAYMLTGQYADAQPQVMEILHSAGLETITDEYWQANLIIRTGGQEAYSLIQMGDIWHVQTLPNKDELAFFVPTTASEETIVKFNGAMIPLKNTVGLKIVVYDEVLGCLADAVHFDIYSEGTPATRTYGAWPL